MFLMPKEGERRKEKERNEGRKEKSFSCLNFTREKGEEGGRAAAVGKNELDQTDRQTDRRDDESKEKEKKGWEYFHHQR